MDKNSLDVLVEGSVAEAQETMRKNIGGPFGAAIVKDGKLVCYASNTVLGDHDPTAHAEINAIRKAGKILGTHDLSGCVLYATGYPCPMCMSAIIWANIKEVYYGCTPRDAEQIGFRDDFIYRFLRGEEGYGLIKLEQFGHDECIKLFQEYSNKNKQIY